MLVVLPLIFVADTKIIYGYNFVASLNRPSRFLSFCVLSIICLINDWIFHFWEAWFILVHNLCLRSQNSVRKRGNKVWFSTNSRSSSQFKLIKVAMLFCISSLLDSSFCFMFRKYSFWCNFLFTNILNKIHAI